MVSFKPIVTMNGSIWDHLKVPSKVGFNEELKIRQDWIKSKDRLILYQEGSFEAQNIQGQAFGVDGLLRALTSRPTRRS